MSVAVPKFIDSDRERIAARERGEEHLGVFGNLMVPVANAYRDTIPVREGWEPFHITVNLSREPQMWVHYKWLGDHGVIDAALRGDAE